MSNVFEKENLLNEEYFNRLFDYIKSDKIPWSKDNVNDFDSVQAFTHMIYFRPFTSFLLKELDELFDVIGLKALIRAKINYYPYTQQIIKHADHTDFAFPHKAAVFSFNTCDGGTYVNKNFYKSKKNKIIIFDGSQTHASTNTTAKEGRYNLAINYF